MKDKYKELDWGGHFEMGSFNEYVFYETKDSERLEVAPDAFIKYVRQLQKELKELREFKHKVLAALNDRDDWDDLAIDLVSEL